MRAKLEDILRLIAPVIAINSEKAQQLMGKSFGSLMGAGEMLVDKYNITDLSKLFVF